MSFDQTKGRIVVVVVFFNANVLFVGSAIQCPPVPRPAPPLRAQLHGTYAGQGVRFSCPDGYVLQGQANVTCLTSGTA